MISQAELNAQLQALCDTKQAAFSNSLTPGALPMLGVRIPQLRQLAKQLAKTEGLAFVYKCQPHYYEHQILQACVLGYAKADIDTRLAAADAFVPTIRDWAVNDAFCQTFTAARKTPQPVWDWLRKQVQTGQEYPQRVAAVTALSHFLNDEYIDRVLALCDELENDGYYTRMGVAWCAATAYAKYPQKTMAYLHTCRLPDWTFNKALQKMCESYRVPEADKPILRAMKRSTV